MELKLSLKNKTKIDISKINFQKKALEILQDSNLTGIVNISLIISGNAYIRSLNKRYRQIDRPTDVLSFPIIHLYRGKKTKETFPGIPELPENLGDIIISYPYAKKQSIEHQITVEEELLNLFAHGLKHLLGYHHR
jgi:probable rRNA maturation factor